MDQTPQRQPDLRRVRHVGLGVLWTAALLGAAFFTGEGVLDGVVAAFGRRFSRTGWALPLAAAGSITVLTSSLVRRRWPQPTRRILLGLIVFAGLYGLTAAGGPLQVLLVLGLVAIVGLLAAWVLVLPRRLAPPLPAETLGALQDRDRLELTDARLKLQNDLRTTALQAIAGLAVLAGAVLAFQQLSNDRQQANATRALTLQGQASERFTRAIDQLGSDRLEVRLGGIYGLEQIARQAPDNRLAVTQVLVAFLHRRGARPANPTTQPAEKLRVRAPEVQAALTVLIRRAPPPADPPPDQNLRGSFTTDPPLDLSGLDLAGADIRGEVILVGPDRERADFRPASLLNADLRGTDLRGAMFLGVYLRFADLGGADLRGTDLRGADSYLGREQFLLGSPAGFDRTKFRGALADSSTQWPSGFDWRAAGVIMT